VTHRRRPAVIDPERPAPLLVTAHDGGGEEQRRLGRGGDRRGRRYGQRRDARSVRPLLTRIHLTKRRRTTNRRHPPKRAGRYVRLRRDFQEVWRRRAEDRTCGRRRTTRSSTLSVCRVRRVASQRIVGFSAARFRLRTEPKTFLAAAAGAVERSGLDQRRRRRTIFRVRPGAQDARLSDEQRLVALSGVTDRGGSLNARFHRVDELHAAAVRRRPRHGGQRRWTDDVGDRRARVGNQRRTALTVADNFKRQDQVLNGSGVGQRLSRRRVDRRVRHRTLTTVDRRYQRRRATGQRHDGRERRRGMQAATAAAAAVNTKAAGTSSERRRRRQTRRPSTFVVLLSVVGLTHRDSQRLRLRRWLPSPSTDDYHRRIGVRVGVGAFRSAAGGGGALALAGEAAQVTSRLAGQVCDVFEHFFVAVSRLQVAAAGQCTGAAVLLTQATTFNQHLLHLSLLRLGKLRRYDDETQVDHEERPDLSHKMSTYTVSHKKRASNIFRITFSKVGRFQ